MSYEQLNFETAEANRILSMLLTLRNYLRASIARHGRPTESVHVVARVLETKVAEIQQAWPEHDGIARQAGKFYELCVQYDLLEPRIGD